MRRSEFDRAVVDEFGSRGASLVADLALSRAGGLTAREALDAGFAARDVWTALCEEADVPQSRRYGVGRMDPRRR